MIDRIGKRGASTTVTSHTSLKDAFTAPAALVVHVCRASCEKVSSPRSAPHTVAARSAAPLAAMVSEYDSSTPNASAASALATATSRPMICVEPGGGVVVGATAVFTMVVYRAMALASTWLVAPLAVMANVGGSTWHTAPEA